MLVEYRNEDFPLDKFLTKRYEMKFYPTKLYMIPNMKVLYSLRMLLKSSTKC